MLICTFSKYLSLKPNHKKFKIVSTAVLRSVKVTVYGMKCTDLFNDNAEVTRINSSYNKEKWNEKKFLENVNECVVLHLKGKPHFLKP